MSKSGFIQYVVVSEEGGVYDCNFKDDLDAALYVATRATVLEKDLSGQNFRVAKLVEVDWVNGVD